MKLFAIVVAIALAVAQPQPLTFPPPSSAPEHISTTEDFPFLPPLARLATASHPR